MTSVPPATDPFVMPDNEKTGTAPTADPDHPFPDGVVWTETLADKEVIANIPNKMGGGFHRIGLGIGADPATAGAKIAGVMKAIECGA